MMHRKVDTASKASFLAGGGEMGALIRAHDWADSSLGEPGAWPVPLRTALRLILNSGHPMYVWWGPELLGFYNDAYRSFIGPERHPSSLGRPAREVWAEIWDIIKPQIAYVMDGHGSTWAENALVPITRNGRREDVYWTYSYGPLDDEAAANGVGGVLVVCSETTAQVEAGRREAAERERLTRMFEQAPSFMVMLEGPEHRFTLVNAAYSTLVGRDSLGKTVRQALPEVEGQGFFELLDRVYSTGEPFRSHPTTIQLARGSDGCVEERVVDFIYQPVTDADGQVTGIFIEGSDVTESHGATERLRQSEARFRAVFQNAGVGVARVALDGKHWIEVNDALCKMLDYPRADLLGTELSDLLNPEDRAIHRPSFFCMAAGSREPFVVEGRLLHQSGEDVWVRQTVSSVRDAGGQPDFQIAVIEDITEQKKAEADLQRSAAEACKAARTDALTDLPNRAAFTETLSRIPSSDPCGVLFLDLNGLKRINDSLGHLAGDEVLISIARRLSGLASSSRFLARISGDEFVFIVTGQQVKRETEVLADAARAALVDPLSILGQSVHLEMAIGYSVHAGGADTKDDLVRHADLAMYEAKRQRARAPVAYSAMLEEASQDAHRIERALRTALACPGEFSLAYQSIVSQPGGGLARAEALARWTSPQLGPVTPDRFIAVAERAGLMVELGQRIFGMLCDDLRAYPDLKVGYNISPVQLMAPGFTAELLNELQRRDLSPGRIELELTESVVVEDVAYAARCLAELREAGFTMALDDFGTGYSSIGYLRQMRFDALKIDRSLVGGLTTDPKQMALVSSMIVMAHAMDLSVVCEGVELEQDLMMLRALGCDFVQGYHIDRPMPLKQLASKWLMNSAGLQD